MAVDLKGRSFLTLKDFTSEEIEYFIDLAIELKQKKKKGIYEKRMKNKNVALIFEKPSTRTRCSFTVGAVDEGAHPEYLGKDDIQLGHKETVEDTARVLGRMFDGIEFRGFSQETVEKLAEYSGVPVWNGLRLRRYLLLLSGAVLQWRWCRLQNNRLLTFSVPISSSSSC